MESSKEVLQSLGSEKELASSETLSGADNAPTPVATISSMQSSPVALREADKEVASSWQTESQGQSAPISMVYHESNANRLAGGERYLNDIKGPPPAYDATTGQTSTANAPGLSAPSPIEPDEVLPPRPEDRSAVGQLLTWVPPAPRSQPMTSRLLQPIVIPQLDVPPLRETVPFQRCYSDVLAVHGVSMQDFAKFLDGLEVAQLPSSTLQGLRMFGVGVSHVPVPFLGPLTGRGISILAGSTSGHSGTRARLYLEQARDRYFKPRGLRVTIINDDDVNSRLQMPPHAPRLGVLTQSSLSATSCQRRLEALGPYAAPLRFDMPEPDKQIQGVQKVARKHLQARFKEKAKKVDEMRQRQWATTAMQDGSLDERYRNKLSEIRNVQQELVRTAGQPGPEDKGSPYQQLLEQLRFKQHELGLIVSERQNSARNDVALAAEIEEINRTRRLKWLVVESA